MHEALGHLNLALCAVEPSVRTGPLSVALKLLLRIESTAGAFDSADPADVVMGQIEELLDHPSGRLAIYGSLAPGQQNHHVVADIEGTWARGSVEGDLHQSGWGATYGYPGMIWRPGGPRIGVHLLESAHLADHWARLDAFEGPGYGRIVVPVDLEHGGLKLANIYQVKGDMAGTAPPASG